MVRLHTTLSLHLDEANLEKFQHFFDIYEFETIIGDTAKKFYLGIKEPRICRFCRKTDKEVTFRTDAHVMPQFMGNRNLLSYFECDECNSHFSSYEDSFANYIGIVRTFAQIKGQTKKVPKFKDSKSGLEVYVEDTGMKMAMIEGNGKDPIIINSDNKSLEITTVRPSYIPIHIPKTLIKIGLSMLPESDLEDYEYARRFIRQTEKDSHFKDSKQLQIFAYFIPGPPKYPTPFAQLYKKKVEKSELLCPSRQLILYYANYCFQILMPFADSDKCLLGKNINFPFFPLLVDNSHFEKFGKYRHSTINLTSNELKKGEEHKLSFSFERLEKKDLL